MVSHQLSIWIQLLIDWIEKYRLEVIWYVDRLPERIAGMSPIFGGVISTKAYFIAVCICGLAATNIPEINENIKWVSYVSDQCYAMRTLIFALKRTFSSNCKVKTILHYVMTFLIATRNSHLFCLIVWFMNICIDEWLKFVDFILTYCLRLLIIFRLLPL